MYYGKPDIITDINTMLILEITNIEIKMKQNYISTDIKYCK